MIAVLRDSERGYLSTDMLKKLVGGEYLISLMIQGPLWLLEGVVADSYPSITVIPMDDTFLRGVDWDSRARVRMNDR